MLFLLFLLSCHTPIIPDILFNVNGAGYQNRTGDPTLAKLRFTIKLILHLAEGTGIEPVMTESKSVVLPLH